MPPPPLDYDSLLEIATYLNLYDTLVFISSLPALQERDDAWQRLIQRKYNYQLREDYILLTDYTERYREGTITLISYTLMIDMDEVKEFYILLKEKLMETEEQSTHEKRYWLPDNRRHEY